MSRPIHDCNIIIIGGTIAAGKSTLVDLLSNFTGFPAISELRENDKLQDLILKKLYEGDRIHLATIQYYFISNRYRQYKEIVQSNTMSILDRGVWEDWIFAKLLMKNEDKSYEHYKKLWKSTVEKIINNFGKPKVYIFVKVNWDSFKNRIYQRNREIEISNFSKNEKYFYDLLNEYNNHFLNILNDYKINTIVINSDNMSKKEMLNYAVDNLKSFGII